MSAQTTDQIAQVRRSGISGPRDFSTTTTPQLQTLIEERGWRELPERERIGLRVGMNRKVAQIRALGTPQSTA